MEDRNREIQAERQRLRRKKEALLKKKARNANTRKSIFKIFLFSFTFVLVFILYDGNFSIDTSGIHLPSFKMPKITLFKSGKNKKNNTPSESIKEKDGSVVHEEIVSNLQGEKIAFVPMDDLPLHSNWISNLMDSTNYKVVMPDTKYYRTQIGDSVNSYAGYSTKFGNPNKIASWLLEMEEEGCNYYIISLDQLFSGGLVSSNYVNNEDFSVYSGDYSTVNKTLEKIMNNKENHIYLFDTIASLSVEANFMGVTENDHNALLQYSSIARKKLTNNDLTIKNITNGYSIDINGNTITTTVDASVLKRFLDARSRKLNLSKYIVGAIAKSPNKDNIHIYYSYNGNIADNNIQSNDISYVESILSKKDINYSIYSGNNSNDLMALMNLYTDNINSNLVVSVHYYGNENDIISGSNYTYKSYLSELFKELNISISNKGYMDILVYTKNIDPSKREEYSKMLILQYVSNIKKHIPTIIINDSSLGDDSVLLEQLKSKSYLGYMIGYSNNSDFFESSRLALFEGLNRYLYLTNPTKNDNADKNYLKCLSYSLVNDMVYISSPVYEANVNVLDSHMNDSTKFLLSNLEKSNYISNLLNYEEASIKSVRIYNYKFPWDRTNEISFVVSVSVGQEREVDLDK